MSERLVRRLVVLAALCIYVPFLGSVRLFDWDEINFAEAAREMLVTGDWLRVHVDYTPFYEKPPLFIWAQAVSMLVFGVNEFAARLPNAIVATITLWLLVRLGQQVGRQRLGLLWAAAYAGSVLPTFYGHTGIIDPLFNLFMFLAVLVAYRSVGQGASKHDAWLAGLWMGLAVLTKGPVALGLVLLTCAIAYAWTRRTWRLPWLVAAKMTLVATAVPALWYGVEYAANGPAFMEANLAYQWRLLTMGEAGHAQPWYYHLVVVLIGCYPASVLAFGQLTPADASDQSDSSDFTKWMATLGLVVLAVFSVVTTKIVHYSSMTYLPLTFLAALAVDRMWRGEARMGVARWLLLGVLCLVLTAAALAVPLIGNNMDWLVAQPTFRDVYLREAVQQPVWWSWIHYIPALLLPLGYVVGLVFRKRPWHVLPLFGGVLLFSMTFLPLVAPNIERYTQGAALDVYESLQGRVAYVKPLTMKSYAHLFYTQKPYELSAAAHGVEADAWEPFLLDSMVRVPTYFVAKVNDAGPWMEHPNLRVRHRHGGIVVFERRR